MEVIPPLPLRLLHSTASHASAPTIQLLLSFQQSPHQAITGLACRCCEPLLLSLPVPTCLLPLRSVVRQKEDCLVFVSYLLAEPSHSYLFVHLCARDIGNINLEMSYYGDYDDDYYGRGRRRPSAHRNRSDRRSAFLGADLGGEGLYRTRSQGHSPAPVVNVYNDVAADAYQRTEASRSPPYRQRAPYPPSPEYRGRRDRLGDDLIGELEDLTLENRRLRSRSRGRSDAGPAPVVPMQVPVQPARGPDYYEWELRQKEKELQQIEKQKQWEQEKKRFEADYELKRIEEDRERKRIIAE